jgi:hypothetical protein
MVETSSEEEDKGGSLPLAALGRDSISTIKVASNEMDRLTLLAEKAAEKAQVGEEPVSSTTTINNNLKSNHVKNNNVNKSNINNPNTKKFNTPKPHQVTDTNANLPKAEINPTVDNKVQIGKSSFTNEAQNGFECAQFAFLKDPCHINVIFLFFINQLLLLIFVSYTQKKIHVPNCSLGHITQQVQMGFP